MRQVDGEDSLQLQQILRISAGNAQTIIVLAAYSFVNSQDGLHSCFDGCNCSSVVSQPSQWSWALS